VPTYADITVTITGDGNGEGECKLCINTDKGSELIEGIDGEREEAKPETEKIAKIRSLRQKEKERLFGETDELISGFDGIIEVFSSCISCHGCCSVCPICYCKLCEFDSRRSDYKPETYEIELKKRGGVSIPPGKIYFQIGRLAHMAISCVGCGMCSDVCPVDIPVSSIFSKVGESTQKMFDYLPGRDINESIPITTFEEHELTEVED
jgi:formate dehydrogenase subunit beta